MLNHITLMVRNKAESTRFYAEALRPLGYELFTKGEIVGLGTKDCDGWRDLWLKEDTTLSSKPSFSCLAFTAPSKQSVDEFYRAALAAGGKDNGAPGYRVEYSPGYYAAFVLDSNGYNIEAVYDDPNPTA